MRTILLSFFLQALMIHGTCQMGFYSANPGALVQVYNVDPLFGSGVSFYDFNHDGWDDLTYCLNGDSVYFFTNTNGVFSKTELIPNTADAKHPVWVDYDNDGDPDFFMTRNNASCQLYRNDGDFTFTDVTEFLNLPETDLANTFGCSWGDYDNDGFLDVYLCNWDFYEGISNWLLHNNGDGTFSEVAVSAGVDDGEHATFQSAWIDFNADGWLDLYIVNDKHHGNKLYQNDGDGTFTDVTLTSGSGIELCAMSNSISDFDLDGDFDIYVSNADVGNFLLQNSGGVFTDVASALNVDVDKFCWGALWIDFDNDGDEDLHVSDDSALPSTQNSFFVNDGDGTFSTSNALGLSSDNGTSFSSAKGDFNHDGFYDFVIQNRSPENTSFFANKGIGGHWLKIGLEGTISNRDGIGTRIEYYTGGQQHLLFTQCGSDYLSQDSQNKILGLGVHTTLDSLILTWPSGWKDSFYDLDDNTFYSLVEGQTYQAEISTLGTGSLCLGGQLVLDAGEHTTYLWDNGETGSTRTIDEPGIYSVTTTNDFGFQSLATITVDSGPALPIDIISAGPSCAGSSNGSIAVVPGSEVVVLSLEWATGEQSTILTDLEAGTYSFELHASDGCILMDTVVLEEPLELTGSVASTDATCSGLSDGTAQVTYAGGTGVITMDWQNLDPEALPAGEFEVTLEDENNCQLQLSYTIDEPLPMDAEVVYDIPCFGEPTAVELTITGGNGNYEVDWSGQDPEVMYAGNYQAGISDQMGCSLEISFSVEENPELVADVTVNPANNGNNGSAVIVVSGGSPPYSYQWSNGSESSVSSGLGQGTYTCTITDDALCTLISEVVIIDILTTEYSNHGILVYPVPFTNEFWIDATTWTGMSRIEVSDITGRCVFSETLSNGSSRVSTEHWDDGVYFVQIDGQKFRILKSH